jgi:hypothetical protein
MTEQDFHQMVVLETTVIKAGSQKHTPRKVNIFHTVSSVVLF